MTPLIDAAESVLELLGNGYLDTRNGQFGPVAACHFCGKYRTKGHEPACAVPVVMENLRNAIEYEKLTQCGGYS